MGTLEINKHLHYNYQNKVYKFIIQKLAFNPRGSHFISDILIPHVSMILLIFYGEKHLLTQISLMFGDW